MNIFRALKLTIAVFCLSFSLHSYAGSTLFGGQTLWPGHYLMSSNGSHKLIMQTDGNLVLYGKSSTYPYNHNRVKFHTQTHGNPGARLIMQRDGNLVVYSKRNKPLWYSRTDRLDTEQLRMQVFNAGYFTLRIGARTVGQSKYGEIIWRSDKGWALYNSYYVQESKAAVKRKVNILGWSETACNFIFESVPYFSLTGACNAGDAKTMYSAAAINNCKMNARHTIRPNPQGTSYGGGAISTFKPYDCGP